jgi:hypothetical protein
MTDDPSYTDRGFAHMPAVASEYGGSVRVYESSAATGPHIWLQAEGLDGLKGPHASVPIHLTLANATVLRDQLTRLIENHYQGASS